MNNNDIRPLLTKIRQLEDENFILRQKAQTLEHILRFMIYCSTWFQTYIRFLFNYSTSSPQLFELNKILILPTKLLGQLLRAFRDYEIFKGITYEPPEYETLDLIKDIEKIHEALFQNVEKITDHVNVPDNFTNEIKNVMNKFGIEFDINRLMQSNENCKMIIELYQHVYQHVSFNIGRDHFPAFLYDSKPNPHLIRSWVKEQHKNFWITIDKNCEFFVHPKIYAKEFVNTIYSSIVNVSEFQNFWLKMLSEKEKQLVINSNKIDVNVFRSFFQEYFKNESKTSVGLKFDNEDLTSLSCLAQSIMNISDFTSFTDKFMFNQYQKNWLLKNFTTSLYAHVDTIKNNKNICLNNPIRALLDMQNGC
jgi:hypothetical protein